MSIWHILVCKGRTTLMEEIRNAYALLSQVGWRQTEINKAVDRVAQAHDDLTSQQAGFGAVIEQAQALMDANPDVEAVECGGSGQILVRMPSGAIRVFRLSSWTELKVPEPDPPAIPVSEADVIFERLSKPLPTPFLTRNGGGFSSLSAKQIDSMAFDHAMAAAYSPDEPEEAE